MDFSKLLKEWKENILKEQNSSNSLALYVQSYGERIDFLLYDAKKLYKYKNYSFDDLVYSDSIIASIFIQKPGEYVGKCMDSYQVISSAVNKKYQGSGYGKMIYGLAMVYIYPSPLMADRSSVSRKAERVWNSLNNNAKVEKLPSNKSPFKGEFDNKYKPTTKPQEDDCVVYSKRDSLNKAYRYNSGENKQLLGTLVRNHEEFNNKIEKEKIKLDWEDLAHSFFNRIYFV